MPFSLLGWRLLVSDELVGIHHFRQAHTAMEARNFAFHDPNILNPTIDGVSYEKELFLNEFPLYPYLVGMLWKAFGENIPLARSIAFLFGILALWQFRRIVARLTDDPLLANAATLAMSLSPIMLYFSRALQRQTLFLFALLLGVHYAVAFLEDARRRQAAAMLGGFALALLLNPFAVYIAVPLAGLLWRQAHRGQGRVPISLALGGISVLPAIAWFSFALERSLELPTRSIMAALDPINQRDFASPSHYEFLLTGEYWSNVYRTLRTGVLPGALSLGVAGLGLLHALRSRRYGFFVAWLAGVVLYFCVDSHPIGRSVHEYYYLNILPPLAFFFALGTFWLWRRARFERSIRVLPAIVAALAVSGFCWEVPTRYFDFANRSYHRDYYTLRDQLYAKLRDGDRVVHYGQSHCPLISYLVNDRAEEFGKTIHHRLVGGRTHSLEYAIAALDFDYLLITWNRDKAALAALLDEVNRSHLFQEPISLSDRRYLIPRIRE